MDRRKGDEKETSSAFRSEECHATAVGAQSPASCRLQMFHPRAPRIAACWPLELTVSRQLCLTATINIS
jgi:hypothetical protein